MASELKKMSDRTNVVLIADSGSSKTDWALFNASNLLYSRETIGLNPDFHSSESINSEVQKLAEQIEELPQEIYFYGSGASSKARQKPILAALEQAFPSAKSMVEHDLLGAARAVHGDNAGLVGILGTGSNCCFYDGKEITQAFRSGGYVLSDEGGGVYLGKLIIKAFIEDYLQEDLRKAFSAEYNYSVDDLLQKIYKESYPNRFLASFSKFARQNDAHPQMKGFIETSFNDFFKNKVSRFDNYQSHELGIVGSVGIHFKTEVGFFAEQYGVPLGKLIKKPIGALIEYHQAKLV